MKIRAKRSRHYGARRPRWNGEKCDALRCIVEVGASPAGWWCADLEGTRRKAILVMYGEQKFLLDDEDDSAFLKLTIWKGHPDAPHKNLPDGSVLKKYLPWQQTWGGADVADPQEESRLITIAEDERMRGHSTSGALILP